MTPPTQTQLKIPNFKSLPTNSLHPRYSAWIWGEDDQLGTLNFLTPESVTRAAGEIQTGLRVGLDWELRLSSAPAEFRQHLKHEIFQIGPNVNVCGFTLAKSLYIVKPSRFHVC